jgi:hypothetical protein
VFKLGVIQEESENFQANYHENIRRLQKEERQIRTSLKKIKQLKSRPKASNDTEELARQLKKERKRLHASLKDRKRLKSLTIEPNDTMESEASKNATGTEAPNNTPASESSDNAMAPVATNNTTEIEAPNEAAGPNNTAAELEANAGPSHNTAAAAAGSAPAIDQGISRVLNRTKSGRVTKDRLYATSFKKPAETSNNMPHGATINTVEPEASSQSIEPEASVQNMEAEVSAQSMEPGASAQSIESGASAWSMEPGASSWGMETGASAQNMEPEALVQNMESGASIHATGSGAPINTSRFSAWSAPAALERETVFAAQDDGMDIEAANNTVATRAPTQTMDVEEPAQPNITATTESPKDFSAKVLAWIPRREVLPKLFSDNQYRWCKRGFRFVSLCFALGTIFQPLFCHSVSLEC